MSTKIRMMEYCRQTLWPEAAKEIAEAIEHAAPAPGHCSLPDCADCARWEQARADAAIARKAGEHAAPKMAGEPITADCIIQWSGVQQGDWAVYLGQLQQVRGAMDSSTDAHRVQVLIGDAWREPLREDWTAVRRYINQAG